MGVALLLGQRGLELDALLGVAHGDLESGLAAAQRHGGHHQPGVAEDFVGLLEALSEFPADHVFNRHKGVVESQRRSIGSPDPVFLLTLAARIAGGVLFHDEKGGSLRRFGQYRDKFRVAAGGNELLAAADAEIR